MPIGAQDDVQNQLAGDEPGLGDLLRRNPFLQRFRIGKPQAQPSTSTDLIGAGDAGSGPNGSAQSNPQVPPQPKEPSVAEQAPKVDLGMSTSVPDLGTSAETKPQLAKQGPKNPILGVLARVSSVTAATPEPGAKYTGPTTPEAKKSAAAHFIRGISNAMMAAGGTPDQREFALQEPLKERELERQTQALKNEAAYRTGMLANKERTADIAEQKVDTQRYGIDTRADVEREKLSQQARFKGYIVDPNTGEARAMTDQEIAADPVLSQHQSLQRALIDKNHAEADLKYAANDPTSPLFKQKQAQLDLANRKIGIELSRLGLAERAENFKEGQATAKTQALSPAAQKILMETGPVKAQIQDLLQRLEPLHQNNTPGYFAGPRALYSIGVHSDANDLAGQLSEVELSRITGAARVLKGSSRAYQIFEKALTHTPDPWKDSPAQMYSKLQTILKNLEDVENDAYKYGANSGAVPVQGAVATASPQKKRNPRYNRETGNFE